MKYQYIADHESEYCVKRMCRVLGVGRSGYYAWRHRPVSQRERSNVALLEKVKKIYQDSRMTYGSPRIFVTLQRQGVTCSRQRVARLMRNAGLQGRKREKSYPQGTQRRAGAVAAPNRLNQDFTAAAPNEKWVTDITYIATLEGWLYLASILDLFSRRVVGWAMGPHPDTPLVIAALEMAIVRRRPPADLLHHSDQGSQYTSLVYQACMQQNRFSPSMSRVANCYDNAVMESFFATVKTECATQPYTSRAQAKNSLFEYIEVWYNRQRLHSTLGYLSPEEFEKKSRH